MFYKPFRRTNIIQMIKSRTVRWPRRVARMKWKRNAYRVKPEGNKKIWKT